MKFKQTLKNITPYAIDWHYPDYSLKLDSNENVYGASPAVIQAIRNFDPEKINHYPAYGALIEKLAEFLGAAVQNFVLTNGCDEAINVFFNAFLENEDEVLSFAPTFSMPELYAEILGAKFVKIQYSKNWEFDLNKFISNIKKSTKILYLTSPNNPTGNLISIDDIKTLAQKYPDKLVFLDCTYFNYAEISGEEYFKLPKLYENIVIAKSFSKDYALAGLRLGYLFASETIINEVRKVISPYSVNSVALCAGLAALSDIPYFKNVKNDILCAKKKLVKGLCELGFKAQDTSANFILCNFEAHADFAYNSLLNNGVKVKYFKGISGLENTFRITAPKIEDVDKILNILSPKPLFVFDLDGVVFDVSNSYRATIKKVVEHFTKTPCTDFDIQSVKNMGDMSNDWDVCAYLIKKAGVSAKYNDIVDVFQNIFYIKGKGGLIDNEGNVLDSKFFFELSKYANCAVFTGRPKEEAFYSLEKFNIKKYFSYFICNEDVEGQYKPSPYGLNKIKKCAQYTDILYFGDTIDDIKAGCAANIKVYGVIPPNAISVEETEQKLFEYGAKGVIHKKEDILELIGKKINAGS